MSTLKTINRQPFEDLFGMDTGYVLDFTNTTFDNFVRESVGRNIYSDRYEKYGESKAKRLRAFIDLEPDEVVVKLLSELLELWEYQNPKPTEREAQIVAKCKAVVDQLSGHTHQDAATSEEQFLRREYRDVDLKKIAIESQLIPILEARFDEALKCLESKAPLAAIFMCGSILEGLLLGTALQNPRRFNQAQGCPKGKDEKPKPFQEWKLAELINVSYELGFLRLDAKKFSHVLRDFRNYVHPYQQMTTSFNPDRHTAEICLQVLRAAIVGLAERAQ